MPKPGPSARESVATFRIDFRAAPVHGSSVSRQSAHCAPVLPSLQWRAQYGHDPFLLWHPLTSADVLSLLHLLERIDEQKRQMMAMSIVAVYR